MLSERDNAPADDGVQTTVVTRWLAGELSEICDDGLVVEQPLEIRLLFGPSQRREERCLTVTMRTPGDDPSLAAGLLFCEGIVRNPEEIQRIDDCATHVPSLEFGQLVRVTLRPDVSIDWQRMQRNFGTSSACGICGVASLEHVAARLPTKPAGVDLQISSDLIAGLPAKQRAAQLLFAATGGSHAASLFSSAGDLLRTAEDVGRHNALDKLIGHAFLEQQLPLSACLLLVSGRCSFDIMQKAVMAALPVVVSVGAPSTLAVELARRFDQTLIAFCSAKRFNIYSGAHRLQDANLHSA